MAKIYLIPSLLHEEGANTIPSYILDAIKDCQVFFVENERTTRRYFKQLWKTFRPNESIFIDDYDWHLIDDKASSIFKQYLRTEKNIGIISEAGCPGIADPGQALVNVAQQMGVTIRPLVGPNSILLALMASGFNGQKFQFTGYLPIDNQERRQYIRKIESGSLSENCTQIFIETPYRNNQLMEALLQTCRDTTKICVGADLTSKQEWIKTKTVADWKKDIPELHKRPAIFLLYAGK